MDVHLCWLRSSGAPVNQRVPALPNQESILLPGAADITSKSSTHWKCYIWKLPKRRFRRCLSSSGDIHWFMLHIWFTKLYMSQTFFMFFPSLRNGFFKSLQFGSEVAFGPPEILMRRLQVFHSFSWSTNCSTWKQHTENCTQRKTEMTSSQILSYQWQTMDGEKNCDSEILKFFK